MKIEIDQSGKIEQLNTPTVLAFANDTQGAAVIGVVVKRQLMRHIRNSVIPKKDLLPIVFAIAIFLLVKSAPANASLIIDEEYTGKDRLVVDTVEKFLQQSFNGKWKGDTQISRIGKRSPAHRLAWSLHRKKRFTAVRHLRFEEVVKLLNEKVGP